MRHSVSIFVWMGKSFALLILATAMSVPVYAQTRQQTNPQRASSLANSGPFDNSMGMDLSSYLKWIENTGRSLHSYYKGYDAARDTLARFDVRAAGSPIFGVVPDGDGWMFGFGAYSNYQTFKLKYRIRVDRNGSVREVETFPDSLKATGDMTFSAQAVKHAIRFLGTANLPKPHDDTIYRIAVLPPVGGNFMVYISFAQRDPEHIMFGMEHELTYERVTGQVMVHRVLHRRQSRIQKIGPAGGMPYVRDMDIRYPTAVDVALVMELDYDTAVATADGTFFIRRDGSVERLADDHPLANPTIRTRSQ